MTVRNESNYDSCPACGSPKAKHAALCQSCRTVSRADPALRIQTKLSVAANGCWEWTGKTRPDGYGLLFDRMHGYRRAHRVSYETFVGPIPDGLQLDHLCRNRGCVNPQHLEPVTARENQRRGEGWAGRRARQTSCVRGHAFDGANTRVAPNGTRHCRTCDRYGRVVSAA